MPSADVLVLLAVAAAGLLAGRWARIPPVASYLLAGVMAGPGGFGWVAPSHRIELVSELGVALLLFGVGIEFSIPSLRRTLPRMLASGTLQVGLTLLLAAALFSGLGISWPIGIFLGFLVSLSSTAIVFKVYQEEGISDTPQGKAAAGILLFQDLALVPMMLLIPVLARPVEGAGAAAAVTLLKSAAAVGGLLFLARAALPRALELAARARTPEIFPIASLVAAFGTAFCAVRLGLSLPIGAFLGGLALSGSRYAQQVFAELIPLRDAFVAIFFTGIGMLLDPRALAAASALLSGIVGLVLLKGLLTGAIVWLLWRSRRLGILVGLGLMQMGEFSFVLAREGVGAGLITPLYEQAALGAAILTMAASPFLMAAAKRLARSGEGEAHGRAATQARNHVLVLGYGTTGRALARVLRETGIPFIAVDLNTENVAAGQRENIPVRFGDASRRGILAEMGVAAARAAVVSVADPGATRRIVSLVRQENPEALIFARARYVAEIEELERLGADEVIPSEFETSIEILVRLLRRLGVPRHIVRIQESLVRETHYLALRGLGASAELLAETRQILAGGILETARVLPGSPACGVTLEQLELRQRTGASILNVVRREEPLPTVHGGTRLEAGDQVVLYGPHEALDRALDLFQPPPSEAGDGESKETEEPANG